MARNYALTWDPAALVPLGIAGSWTLAFQDEFNGTVVDPTKWQILDPDLPWTGPGLYSNTADFGNQTWSDTNIVVSGSKLTATFDGGAGGNGGGVVSKWPMGYGCYEARLRFNGGAAAWWLADHGLGDPEPQNPAVSGTEMDLAEAMVWTGNNLAISQAVHWNGYGAGHQSDLTPTSISDGAFHVIGFHWTSTYYKFYVDGVLAKTFTTAISQTLTQYMILNNTYGSGATAGSAEWDYVRYWTP